jgi:DNA-binding transcriptional LysR family regulator
VNDEPGPIGRELDLRALRYFIAAAEELHFTRAAARLFIAQQALSRDIAGLEHALGTQLFSRTTRRVALTPAGERLLVRARELLALHDATWRELRPAARTYVADLLSEGRRTGLIVLEAAREAAPDVDFRGVYGGGMARTVSRLLAGEIDVGFGRADWTGRHESAALEAEVIRFEPLALLLPENHSLAELDVVPVAALDGLEIDVNIDDPASPEWTDLARQLLAFANARPVPAHPTAIGVAEASHHLRRQGLPILTGVDTADVPGGVVRAIVEPTVLFPWSIVHRRGSEVEAGVASLLEAARSTSQVERWLDRGTDAWLPAPERSADPTRTEVRAPIPRRTSSR